MNILRLTLIGLLALVVSACGDDTQFRITGLVNGLGTRYITMYYTTPTGIVSERCAAIDGKIELTGNSREYTIAELYVTPQYPVGRLLVKNGETVKCRFELDDPFNIEVSGSKPSAQWAEWITSNASLLRDSTSTQINAAIARYVTDHPDRIASTALLLTMYNSVDNEAECARLFNSIKESARPENLVETYRYMLSVNNEANLDSRVRPFTLYSYGDSLERFTPHRSSYSLLYFITAMARPRTQSIQAIKPLYEKYSPKRLRVVEVSFAPDTMRWQHAATADPVPWASVWTPGGPASPTFSTLRVPRTPYYILADSMGSVVYRGSLVTAATDSLEKRLNR